MAALRMATMAVAPAAGSRGVALRLKAPSAPAAPVKAAPALRAQFLSGAKPAAGLGFTSSLAGSMLRSLRAPVPHFTPSRSPLPIVASTKPTMGAMKRSRSKRSIANVSGYRARLMTPNGRLVLKRRRTRGRKRLCPAFSVRTGKHTPSIKKFSVY
eukprot:jgi/Chlat1/1289/Chrsp118S01730